MGYILCLYSLYITSRNLVNIRLVGLLCKLVVIGREYTFDIVTHGKTESTNTTKQIYTLIFLHH